jgi:hypothetical protein
MSETIWRATDADGKCYEYHDDKPIWDGATFGVGYGTNWNRYHGPNQPPPGECWEMTLTRKGDIDTDGDPIGWKIVGIGNDGSVLCEKGNGQRRRYSFGDWAKEQLSGEAWERLTKERDEALRELANERASCGQVTTEQINVIAELQAKLERPEMPECVRELVDAVCLEFPGFFAKKIAAVEAHYAPPFRIDGLGVYLSDSNSEYAVVHRFARGEYLCAHLKSATPLHLLAKEDGSFQGGGKLTKFVRPLEG